MVDPSGGRAWSDEPGKTIRLPIHVAKELNTYLRVAGEISCTEISTLEPGRGAWDIGREIGLTRERVRQIQVEALKELRTMLTGAVLG